MVKGAAAETEPWGHLGQASCVCCLLSARVSGGGVCVWGGALGRARIEVDGKREEGHIDE